MAKIKLTKGELKKQRDALRQYLRYLPTLQLKKQQLQIEILRQIMALEERELEEQNKRNQILAYAGLFAADPGIEIAQFLKVKEIVTSAKNIAGVDVPIFERVEFNTFAPPLAGLSINPKDNPSLKIGESRRVNLVEYDLFLTPLWVDAAIEALKELISVLKEIEVIKKGILILRQELRITSQRVNLFEKVKIPQAEEYIRLIKIYLGDQMANAVGRSKIAKRKIEQAALEERYA